MKRTPLLVMSHYSVAEVWTCF